MRFHECTSGIKVDLPRGTIIRASNQGDGEVFGFTNFAKDGEIFMNEFSRTRSVNSYVRLAVKQDERGRSPKRMFQPFLKEDAEFAEPVEVDGSQGGESSSEDGDDDPELSSPGPASSGTEEGDAPAQDAELSPSQPEGGSDRQGAQGEGASGGESGYDRSW